MMIATIYICLYALVLESVLEKFPALYLVSKYHNKVILVHLYYKVQTRDAMIVMT